MIFLPADECTVPPASIVRIYNGDGSGCDAYVIRTRTTTLQGHPTARPVVEALSTGYGWPIAWIPEDTPHDPVVGCVPAWAQPDRWEAIDDLGYGGG